jgi:cell division protein FtsL
MALFGIVATPPPQGQHRRGRKEQILVAGAVQKNKKPSPILEAIGKLSMREKAMVVSLAIVAVVAVSVFVFILPALDTINSLEAEITTLETEKSEVQSTLDRIPSYQQAAEEADRDYQNYRHFYYPFMDPETIDKTVTTMLLENDMLPQRLSMTAIASEVIPAYVPFTLVPKPLPSAETTGDTGEGSDAENDGKDAAEGASGEGGQAGEGSEAGDDAASANPTGIQDGKLIYCYTVDIEAQGWMVDLYTFLAQAKGITAMEVVSYSYIDPEPPVTRIDEDGDVVTDWPEGGTIIMQLKLYVLVDGGVTGQAA